MSRRRVQHLGKRGGNYELRFPIPRDLQPVFQRNEFRWSARTRDPQTAKQRALSATLAFDDMCAKVRAMAAPTPSQAKALANLFYEDLVKDFSGHAPVSADELDYQTGLQETLTEEWLHDLESQQATRDFSDEIITKAAQQCSVNGFDMPEPGTLPFQAICEAIIRAELEFMRLAKFRLSNALDDYMPEDPIFRTPQTLQSIAESSSSKNPASSLFDTPLALAIEKHIEAMTAVPQEGLPQWRPKTAKEKRRSFEIALGLWGEKFPVGQLTASHIRDVRDFVAKMKTQAKLDRKNLNAALASKSEKKLNYKTANKYFGDVRSLVGWLHREDYTDTWVGRDIALAKPKGVASDFAKSWSVEQINTLFGSPLFSGFKHKHRRHQPGPKRLKDSHFWLFLLAYYSGARLAEIVQLRRCDVKINDDYPSIEISKEGQLKNTNSARVIPLHKDLLEFGFDKFLAQCGNSPGAFLFKAVHGKSKDNPGDRASKIANKYLGRIGLKDEKGLKFHTFRHTFIDIARDAEIPEAAIKQLVGHSDNSTTAKYGSGASLETLTSHVHKMKFGLSDEVRDILRKL